MTSLSSIYVVLLAASCATPALSARIRDKAVSHSGKGEAMYTEFANVTDDIAHLVVDESDDLGNFDVRDFEFANVTDDIAELAIDESYEMGDGNFDVRVAVELGTAKHEYYQIWAAKADDWINKAILRLHAGRKLMKSWFNLKKLSDAELNSIEMQMKKRLQSMKSKIENLYIEKGGNEECTVRKKRGGSHGVLAFVYPGQRRGGSWVVHICPYQDGFNGDTATRTLIHELSHHTGTDDHAYGKKACLRLPPKQALRNADNYALFIYQLVKHKRADGRFLYEEGSGIPHAKCNLKCDADTWNWKLDDSMGQQALDFLPPLGSCLHCEWKNKKIGLAGWVNWAQSPKIDEGECGGGGTEWRVIDADDCEANGCEYIQKVDCLKASKALGLSFDQLEKKKRSFGTQFPYGCHSTSEGLFYNKNWKSEVEASPSEEMICECPLSHQYGETTLSRACCTIYPCEEPKK